MFAIQEIFKKFFSKEKHNANEQIVVKKILECKTPALGGNVYECDECKERVVHYNSCRNRHCPCCQAIEKAKWADKQLEKVINAPYFHVVFTIPEELRMLVYHNQSLLYSLMYKAVKETIVSLSSDKKYLGAQIGFLSVLHTWGEDLRYHPHLHVVVMAGGLTKEGQWRKSSKKFFIPVKVLSKVFRGKFLHYLKSYYYEDKLNFFGITKQYMAADSFEALLTDCYGINWYTYSQKTFSGPGAVVRYLARYTHRIAIANERIVSVDDEKVIIRTKKGSTKSLPGVEFVRRFLMHVLPKGFVKVRSYGLLANCNKKTKLALCRKLTNSDDYSSVFKDLSILEILSLLVGKDMSLCSFCGNGKMFKTASLLPLVT